MNFNCHLNLLQDFFFKKVQKHSSRCQTFPLVMFQNFSLLRSSKHLIFTALSENVLNFKHSGKKITKWASNPKQKCSTINTPSSSEFKMKWMKNSLWFLWSYQFRATLDRVMFPQKMIFVRILMDVQYNILLIGVHSKGKDHKCWGSTKISFATQLLVQHLAHIAQALHCASGSKLYATILNCVVSYPLSDMAFSHCLAANTLLPPQQWVLPCCICDITPLFVSLRFSLARKQCPFLGTKYWRETNKKTNLSLFPHSRPPVFRRSSWTNANL